MNKKIQKVLKYLLFAAVGAGLFYLAFKDTDIEQLQHDFAGAKYEYVIASIFMGYLAFISRAIRWKYLLKPFGYKVKTWNSIHAIALGYFSNLLVPRAGEVARCTALYQMENIPVNKLFGTVILERIIDMFMLLGLILITLITQFDRITSLINTSRSSAAGSEAEGNETLFYLKIGALVITILTGITFLILRKKFSTHPLYLKVRDFLIGLKEGLQSFSKVERKWAFIAHTFFIWLMYYLMVYVVVFSLESTSGIDPLSGLFVMIAGGLGMIVPSPGGIGSYHYLVMLACGVLGIANSDGVSFATLVHSGQTIMTIVGGGIAFIHVYRVRKKLKAKLANGQV